MKIVVSLSFALISFVSAGSAQARETPLTCSVIDESLQGLLVAISGRNQAMLDLLQDAPNISWEGKSRDLLHTMAGDDIHAFFGFAPNLTVLETQLPNAYAQAPNKLFISAGLLSLVRSQSELAFILAHEIAHVVLGHTSHYEQKKPRSVAESLRDELEADRYALELMLKAGLAIEDSTELLRRLGLIYEAADSTVPAGGNPTLTLRIAEIERLFARYTTGIPYLSYS